MWEPQSRRTRGDGGAAAPEPQPAAGAGVVPVFPGTVVVVVEVAGVVVVVVLGGGEVVDVELGTVVVVVVVVDVLVDVVVVDGGGVPVSQLPALVPLDAPFDPKSDESGRPAKASITVTTARPEAKTITTESARAFQCASASVTILGCSERPSAGGTADVPPPAPRSRVPVLPERLDARKRIEGVPPPWATPAVTGPAASGSRTGAPVTSAGAASRGRSASPGAREASAGVVSADGPDGAGVSTTASTEPAVVAAVTVPAADVGASRWRKGSWSAFFTTT